MSEHLVPIRVKIKVGIVQGKKQHKYPDFNTLPSNVRKSMDWSYYLDLHGIGWHYDKCCGFGETDDYNADPDVWFGATCVPADFAEAAAKAFPDVVEILDEGQFETFYDTRAHVHEPEENYNLDAMQAIYIKKQLGKVLTQSDTDALDPDKPNAGITRNHDKTWKLYKAKKGVQINSSSSSSSG